MKLRLAAAVTALLLTAVLPTAAPAAEREQLPVAQRVLTAGFQFVPPTVVVTQGEPLVHTNADPFPHNVNSTQRDANGQPLFHSTPIGAGASADVKGVSSLAPGSYPFICIIHPTMKGTLEVRPAPAAAVPVIAGGGVPTPTSIAVTEGALYAASWQQGTVFRLPLLAGGLLGPPTPYATGFDRPLGITFAPDGTLYVADSHDAADPARDRAGRVWALPPGGGAAASVGRVVVDQLPNGRHNTNGMAVHGDRLYITNGNSTDDGFSGGQPEQPLSGTVLSVALDARNLTPADAEPDPADPDAQPAVVVEARGLRNPFDLAFAPDGAAWVTNNGPDALDPFGEDTLHRLDPAKATADYGFPSCVYRGGADGPVVGQNPAAPPCGEHTPPDATLGLHVSANGVALAPADGYWDGDLFITEFGNNPGETSAGRKVVRVPLEDGRVAGPVTDVVAGVTPLDVTFGPDGLYVADFASGTITLLRPPV